MKTDDDILTPDELQSFNEENQMDDENNGKASAEKRGRDINRFPITRIRTIMKMEPDLTIASQESVYLITKAAELFVQLQAKEAYKRTKQAKRKTVQKKDLDSAIVDVDSMAFLEGAIE